MDSKNLANETLADTTEKQPWTDPELVQTAIVDHTLGGLQPVGAETASYRNS